MYIKSVVIDGFKSYGQKTEIINFDPLFNAITGLNGTGKSNILDAICFVLGITNLSHMRANDLQDLIFKSGHAGISKATVSITFDNSNTAQSPPGFEHLTEIIVTRQIALGAKNKYWLNGLSVNLKKIQDFFYSIQLNVNNPHFLIMQGHITKVLNMRPADILSMLEEAAGTRMYEVKRSATLKIIERKDAKLAEFEAIMNEEVKPKLEQLKLERENYIEFERNERELKHLTGLYQVLQYFEAKKVLENAEKSLKNGQEIIDNYNQQIEQHEVRITELDNEIETISANTRSEHSHVFSEAEANLKSKEKAEAKLNAALKSVKDNISSENQKLVRLEQSKVRDENALKIKEDELNTVKALFDQLKENAQTDNQALELTEKKYEALCAGMEVNDQGETETLAEQLMKLKETATNARTESKQAEMQLKFSENELKTKNRDRNLNSSVYENGKAELAQSEREVVGLENRIKNLNYAEDRMVELNNRHRVLSTEIRNLRDDIHRFEGNHPYSSFKYQDPEPNFNKSSIKGIVCRLFKCTNNIYAKALETAAGGQLYNVVIDNEITGKKLLQNGQLQRRTTFLPLNKITPHRMDERTINFAQNLVGNENCQPALSLITYDRSVQKAMELIFGNVFICKDIDVAKKVTFHNNILKRCVTLDGDSTDPAGILGGGAQRKEESVLILLNNISKIETELKTKELEFRKIEQEFNSMNEAAEIYNSTKRKLDVLNHNIGVLKQRLLNTTFAQHEHELEALQTEITELRAKIKTCKEIETTTNKKITDLETIMKDSAGYKQKRLKEADAELKKAKTKAEKSKNEWTKREQEYETLTLEIDELKKSIENTRKEINKTEESLRNLEALSEQHSVGLNEMKEEIKVLQSSISKVKVTIAEKNKEVEAKLRKKDELLAQNAEFALEIKKQTHSISELKNNFKSSKQKAEIYAKKMENCDAYLEEARNLSRNQGLHIEEKMKSAQEKKQRLGRIVNVQAQSIFESEMKRCDDINAKHNIVLLDKKKLLSTIRELDQRKEEVLKLAIEQVSKDFGSIFSTLLPGSNAKLTPLQGKSILQGLEIKIALGNVWKESLTELSGGQRSLAALSLILAMLLFKPAPLYILDEVDAALDLSHTQNIGNMIKSYFKQSQFIIVSLKDGMFNNANVLFKTKFIDGVSAVERTANTRKNH